MMKNMMKHDQELNQSWLSTLKIQKALKRAQIFYYVGNYTRSIDETPVMEINLNDNRLYSLRGKTLQKLMNTKS